MRRNRFALFLLASVLCFLPAAVFALSGQVTYTEGDVSIRSSSGVHPAQIGDALGTGDVIVTSAQSLAVIDLANGTTLKLREKTTLAIDSIGDQTTVNLTSGGVFTTIVGKLTGRFSVRTQSAVAGVRGTEFFVAYGRTIDAQPDVWLCVNSGIVDVAIPDTGQDVQVKAGLGINIVGGTKITTPRRYPWTRHLNWNVNPGGGKVQDSTSLEAAYSDLLDQDYD
jgi:hypothetical protein